MWNTVSMMPLGFAAGGGGVSSSQDAVKSTQVSAKRRGAERRKNAMIFKESKLRKLLCYMGVTGRFFSKKRRAHSRIEWARTRKGNKQDYFPAFSKSYNDFTSASAKALL